MSTRGQQGGRGRGAARGRGNDRGGGGGPPAGRGMGGGRGGDRGGGGPPAGRGMGGGRGSDRGGGGGPGAPPFRGGGGPPRGRGMSGPVIYAANTPVRIDPRLTDASHDQLVVAFKKLAVKSERPLRPGYGTLGIPITLRANFFAVTGLPKLIYEYKVDITPKTDINRLKFRIFDLLELSPLCSPHLPYIAHDRSGRLVAARKLPQPLSIQVPFYEDGQTGPRPNATVYTVEIVFQRELDTAELTRHLSGNPDTREYDAAPLISALNLVLQQHASRTGVRVGKNRYFFRSASESIELGTGVEAWKGFFASVRPTYKQLMVNVNVCMTAFYTPGNLAEAIMAFGRGSHGSMPTLPKAFAKGIRVTTKHLGYKMKKPLKAIGSTSARNTSFDCEEFGGKISVEAYFKKKYNITLRHPVDLPVVDIGSAKRNNWIPAELCEIEAGQPYRAKLDDKQTANMIRYACNTPRVNAESIVNKGLPILGYAAQNHASPIQGFGLTISNEMTGIPARQLAAPALTYRSGPQNVRDGSWNILDVKFHRGAVVQSWWVLVVLDDRPIIQRPDDNLKGLVSGFAEKCRKSGMTMPSGFPRLLVTETLMPVSRDPGRVGALNQIKQRIVAESSSAPKPSFILVLLSGRDNFIYPGIKRLGDVEMGVHTVHMQLSKALGEPKKQDQYFSNVALKLNTKLGGLNHLLNQQSTAWLTKKNTMMVGIDVSHPGPSSREGTPSVAAVVASVDDSFVQFPASMRVQGSKKEMLDELVDMLVERLLVYEKKNKVLPDRIFVYRDGVSEGQFDTVLEEEYPQMLDAFKKLSTAARKTPYRPKLSIIICGKRHHARFYPTTDQNADRNGNTRPGTVVDKGVTGVFDFDFYLQAHAGLQGTVRPTHYTVIYDENGLGADEIQQGTHHLSYLYGRATKAVSLIPAAYYADLACERGRCYINEFLNDDKGTTSGRGSGRGDRDAERQRVFEAAQARWGQGLHASIRDSMFYI